MIIARHRILIVTLFVALSVSCQGQSSPEGFAISTATPGSAPSTSWTNFIPQSPEEYVTSAMPRCQGLTDLGAPLAFDWPNIEEALEKLAEYNWGYYTCDLTQPALQIFLRDNMPKPPYLWREVNHASHNNGQVNLFYQPFSVIFMYIWTLPKPDTRSSYMIIARGDPGVPQTWECRKRILPTNLFAVRDIKQRNEMP